MKVETLNHASPDLVLPPHTPLSRAVPPSEEATPPLRK